MRGAGQGPLWYFRGPKKVAIVGTSLITCPAQLTRDNGEATYQKAHPCQGQRRFEWQRKTQCGEQDAEEYGHSNGSRPNRTQHFTTGQRCAGNDGTGHGEQAEGPRCFLMRCDKPAADFIFRKGKPTNSKTTSRWQDHWVSPICYSSHARIPETLACESHWPLEDLRSISEWKSTRCAKM